MAKTPARVNHQLFSDADVGNFMKDHQFFPEKIDLLTRKDQYLMME